ncbi:MAG: hypothetical protein IH631_02815 [Candidatus Thorarchaeota archaeon]|nr:hypothetical protein [Candidatus Thorarchaeota archaeon]
MMPRRSIIAVSIVILVIFAAGGIYFLVNDDKRSATNLVWSVDVGDEFIYQVETSHFVVDNFYNISSQDITAINNTRIRMVITSLPDIPQMINGELFITEVINLTKTHCSFENGSEITPSCYNVINTLLSATLLPTGDWTLLDILYPDEVSDAFYPGEFTSALHDDYFLFGYELWTIDAIIRWSANVSLDNGIPLRAVDYKDSSGSTGIQSMFILNLIF